MRTHNLQRLSVRRRWRTHVPIGVPDQEFGVGNRNASGLIVRRVWNAMVSHYLPHPLRDGPSCIHAYLRIFLAPLFCTSQVTLICSLCTHTTPIRIRNLGERDGWYGTGLCLEWVAYTDLHIYIYIYIYRIYNFVSSLYWMAGKVFSLLRLKQIIISVWP